MPGLMLSLSTLKKNSENNLAFKRLFDLTDSYNDNAALYFIGAIELDRLDLIFTDAECDAWNVLQDFDLGLCR
ncbi:hypothetical protein T281_00610 [Rhodomicrobium udaipurense JA643]|nr:hypothetical protein T281_00610 [Rhodomicrobium udaipurense JA643]